MSEQVKRYLLDAFIDNFYTARKFVLASDYDALAQRCRELEAERAEIVDRLGKLQTGEDGILARVVAERDTLRATLTAARDKLGPAVRSRHPALTELAAAEVLEMLEAACADTAGDTPEA